MKKKSIILILAITIVIVIAIVVLNINKSKEVDNGKTKIVTSFYPIYIMTLNITDGVDGVTVSNMAEAHTGCIHDYTLNTSDLKKFENADIFIQNGQGIESFTEKILASYPNIKTIDSSENIVNIIEEEDEVNAHFWTSIDNYISQIKTITEELKKIDSKNSDKYEENTLKYISKLEILKSEYELKKEELSNKKVISLNESFSYLFNFLGMEETLIETDHEQSSLSAEVMKEIIDKINKDKIEWIIIGENDNEQNANAIKSETNIKIYKLKDGMSGDNSLNSYIDIMRYNLDVLSEIRGEL